MDLGEANDIITGVLTRGRQSDILLQRTEEGLWRSQQRENDEKTLCCGL